MKKGNHETQAPALPKTPMVEIIIRATDVRKTIQSLLKFRHDIYFSSNK